MSDDSSKQPDESLILLRVVGTALVPLPASATEQSAGVDLAASISAPVCINPGERVLIPTGISLAIPPGLEGQVRPRSGLALAHGITVLNAPGTIDADYRGEIKVILINLGAEPYTVMPADRIAQLVIAPVVRCRYLQVQSLPETDRGEGGFGHSGRR